jgi:hypothetical protein
VPNPSSLFRIICVLTEPLQNAGERGRRDETETARTACARTLPVGRAVSLSDSARAPAHPWFDSMGAECYSTSNRGRLRSLPSSERRQ